MAPPVSCRKLWPEWPKNTTSRQPTNSPHPTLSRGKWRDLTAFRLVVMPAACAKSGALIFGFGKWCFFSSSKMHQLKGGWIYWSSLNLHCFCNTKKFAGLSMYHVLSAESAWQHGSKQPPPSVPFLAVEIMPKQITDARAKGRKVHGCIELIAMAQHWMNEMPQVSWWCFLATGVLFLVFFNFVFL